jgi:hypothetical protein
MAADTIGQERTVFLAASQQKKQGAGALLHDRTPWTPPSSGVLDADCGQVSPAAPEKGTPQGQISSPQIR